MSVLILADAQDVTAGRVAAELTGRGVQVHAVDPAGFPVRLRLAAEIGPGAAWSGRIGGDAEVDLTVRIDNNEPGEIDWRASYGNHDYEPITLPEDVNTGLIRLHQRLGLAYGAADLIQDASTGKWTFLETNCAGEWAWLADETGIEVAGRLADLLVKGRP